MLVKCVSSTSVYVLKVHTTQRGKFCATTFAISVAKPSCISVPWSIWLQYVFDSCRLSRWNAADQKLRKWWPIILALNRKPAWPKYCKNQRFSIIMDETPVIASKKCLAVTISYFDKRLVSRILCFIKVLQATAQHLFDAVKSTLAEMQVSFKNIIGYGECVNGSKI